MLLLVLKNWNIVIRVVIFFNIQIAQSSNKGLKK